MRSALIAGASGLVGRALVDEVCANPSYGSVHILARRDLRLAARHATVHVVDFNRLESLVLPHIDDVYCCLGTTRRVAGSRDAFYLVDYTYVLAVARAAMRAGARRCGFVSAAGANLHSWMFYSRVKAQAERDLASLGFGVTVIVRPSFLAGERARLGQPPRFGEKWMLALLRALGPLVPARWRPIAAFSVARALVRGLTDPSLVGVRCFESDVLQAFATRPM